ncbi:60S acidic ribosomal protein P1 [Branchiostoma belcheri]|nr:60S acidic ribosomal protein P1 [Branchiostoma belcheri]
MSGHVTNPSYFISFVKRGDREKAHAWQLAIDAARTGGSTSGGTSMSRQVEVLSNRGMDEEEEKQEQLEIGPRTVDIGEFCMLNTQPRTMSYNMKSQGVFHGGFPVVVTSAFADDRNLRVPHSVKTAAPYRSQQQTFRRNIYTYKANGISGLTQLESDFMKNLPQRPAKVHNVLRTLGTFPLILTTNQDELLERLLWGRGSLGSALGEKIRLDQVGQVMKDWPELHRHLIVKMFGDTSYTARCSEESRQFLEDILIGEPGREVAAAEFLAKVFQERPVLFLGCDLQNDFYKRLLTRFVTTAPIDHYTFESSEIRGCPHLGSLVTLKANLELWEFVQYLSTGRMEENIQPGQVYEKSYLGTQREEYLLQQLALEKQASEIVFHTSSITNALATDDALEFISKPALQDIYSSDPFVVHMSIPKPVLQDINSRDPFGVFTEEHVTRSLDAMKARRDNLIKKIHEGTKVVTLFFYHGLKAELDPNRVTDPRKRQMAIKKYVEVIKLCQTFVSSKSSLEIRIVDWTDPAERREIDKEKFGLARLKGGEDEAIFHGHPATAGKKAFAVQLIAINGEETARKRKIYEKSRERSWSAEDSVRRLLQEVLGANRDLVDRHGEHMSAIKKEDLEMLQNMSEIHLLTNKKLDQGSDFIKIGSGSFSTVHRATRQGRPVAVKILNEVQHTRDLKAFQDEFKLLRDMKHANIVQVVDCIVQDNRLGIIMEFVDGGNLRDHLRKSGAQEKDFVLRFAKQIGLALEYLHGKDVMHRDVKPENVFISEDHSIFKLGDFGLARVTEGTRQTKTIIGSYRYMAPEVKSSSGHYSKKADVYSYALCLIELIGGEMVFSNIAIHKHAMDEKLRGGLPDIPKNCDEFGPRMKPTIEGCLRVEAQRPSMSKVLQMLFGSTPLKTDAGHLELLCLGTGDAAAAVFEGSPSSSVTVMFNGSPVILINVGLGVLRSCQQLRASRKNVARTQDLGISVSPFRPAPWTRFVSGKRQRCRGAPFRGEADFTSAPAYANQYHGNNGNGQLPNLVFVSSRHSDHAEGPSTRRTTRHDAQLTILCPDDALTPLQKRCQDDNCDDTAMWISCEPDKTHKVNNFAGRLGVRMLPSSPKNAEGCIWTLQIGLYRIDDVIITIKTLTTGSEQASCFYTDREVVTVVEADNTWTDIGQSIVVGRVFVGAAGTLPRPSQLGSPVGFSRQEFDYHRRSVELDGQNSIRAPKTARPDHGRPDTIR